MTETQFEQLIPVARFPESPVEKFREFLEIAGEKLTQPRRVLVRHIFNTHKHFDADELFRDLHDAGNQVSRSTVYRTLRLLVESGCSASFGLPTAAPTSTTTAILPTITCTAHPATGSSSSATMRS